MDRIGQVDGSEPRERTEVLLPNDDVYFGELKRGVFEGEGTYTFANKTIYTGAFSNGKPNGVGVHIIPNGSRYEGMFKNGKRHGKINDQRNEPNCFGYLVLSSGNRYEGMFTDGKQTGFGKFTFSKDDPNHPNEQYIGYFLSGKFHGSGTYYYRNGDQFQGNFSEGFMHGKGKYICANGNVVDGEWKGNRLLGIVKFCILKRWLESGNLIVMKTDQTIWETVYDHGAPLTTIRLKGRSQSSSSSPNPSSINTMELINENQELKRKMNEAVHQIGILEHQLSSKKSQFQDNMTETRRSMRQMQEMYEARAAEMSRKLADAQKQTEMLERNKKDLEEGLKAQTMAAKHLLVTSHPMNTLSPARSKTLSKNVSSNGLRAQSEDNCIHASQ